MFSIFGHKKDKYPLHDEAHIVHNTGLFSSFKGEKDEFHQKIKKALNFINVNKLEQTKKQYTIITQLSKV